MLCQICSKKEATVHLTQMLNDSVRKLHLCEPCAQASGLDLDEPASVTNFLLGLGAPKQNAAKTAARGCARCGMRFSDFRKMGRLGCQHCYAAFMEELEPLLQGMQKGARHVGKQPARHAANVMLPPSRLALQKTLAAAVAAENYEEAARVRDQLHAAETGGADCKKERPS